MGGWRANCTRLCGELAYFGERQVRAQHPADEDKMFRSNLGRMEIVLALSQKKKRNAWQGSSLSCRVEGYITQHGGSSELLL